MLEAEHARNLLKLAQTMRPLLKEESFLPFQSIYCTAIDQDLDNANNCLSNCTLLHDHKFVEPLAAGRNEHDKMRKQIKETWQRELKKMQEADSNVRKCRLLYVQRQHEYEKARERGTDEAMDPQKAEQKAEKRRKAEEEMLVKAREAEAAYKASVVEANDAAASIERTKADVLRQVRELIGQCDNTMKAVTVAYFQLQHSVTAPAPVQFQTLCESSRLYEPGSQYTEFVKRIPMPALNSKPERPQYVFELYRSEVEMGSDENLARAGLQERRLSTDEKIKRALWPSSHSDSRPFQATVQTRPSNAYQSMTSDSDSVSSNKSRDTSPTASPQLAGHMGHGGHGMVHASSGDELEADTVETGVGVNRKMCLSRAAETHSFRKLKTPSRCRECDSYVYFQGVECSECGLSAHKKCLETLAIQCGHKRLPRRMTTFGVDLIDHAQFTFSTSEDNVEDVPFIVKKCVKENDKRGCNVQGIYRVSAAKSKVEKLCQCFENGAELVDLSDYHPNVIANVLKLYLRQLPEPLLTYNLYPEFIAIAKEFPSNREDSMAAVGILRKTAKNLPRVHYSTLASLLKHLRKVASNSEANNMPASNLGIVFGPTLLRTREGSASLSNLVDTVHQSRVIELLITYVDEIFDTDMRDKSVSDLLNFQKLSVDSVSVPRSKSGSFRRKSDRSGSRRGNKPSSKDDSKLDAVRKENAKESGGLLSATSATSITAASYGMSSVSHDLNTSGLTAIISSSAGGNGLLRTSHAVIPLAVNSHTTVSTTPSNTTSLVANANELKVAVTSPKVAEKNVHATLSLPPETSKNKEESSRAEWRSTGGAGVDVGSVSAGLRSTTSNSLNIGKEPPTKAASMAELRRQFFESPAASLDVSPATAAGLAAAAPVEMENDKSLKVAATTEKAPKDAALKAPNGDSDQEGHGQRGGQSEVQASSLLYSSCCRSSSLNRQTDGAHDRATCTHNEGNSHNCHSCPSSTDPANPTLKGISLQKLTTYTHLADPQAPLLESERLDLASSLKSHATLRETLSLRKRWFSAGEDCSGAAAANLGTGLNLASISRHALGSISSAVPGHGRRTPGRAGLHAGLQAAGSLQEFGSTVGPDTDLRKPRFV
ncbi:minor histocompatibility protein HA-1-like [Tropilaelaps mercedesae]|uniref:Minor histocompatibility protein HA-1-like n=1 Tax=Tropilaelaps mercedesae TaxID=418985 RepID=A0A1V9X7I9_9ACAR|nr:minor histocompatibility protein HA-1-like [Tropilaelaps mercedesae]